VACLCVCIQLRVRVVFLLDHMLSTSEDDTKALTHIVKVWLSVWLTRNTAIGINNDRLTAFDPGQPG